MRDDLKLLLLSEKTIQTMNKGKYVFAQLIEFLPQRVFDGIVDKYSGCTYYSGGFI